MKINALLAELIGTFALIFVGCSSIALNQYTDGGLGLVGIALAHGLTIAVFASAFGHISGGHFNPAVTLAMLVAGKIKLVDTLGYIVAQMLGALAGAAMFMYAIPENSRVNTLNGVPMLAKATPQAEAITVQQGILIEAALTFFLVIVIFGTAVDRRAAKVGGLYIGLAIVLDILAGGPLTGAAMNPARFFGPALVSGIVENPLVYTAGPILGGLLAALAYRFVLAPEELKES